MAIWRGVGGSGESTNDSTVPTVTALLVDAEAARDAAQLAETNAETAASNAASSASTASTQASNAATSASNAASSAGAASTSASNAASSASTASTQASNASSSATSAASSASSASTSASNAASSATSAASSASTATTKASEAATSATNAAAYELSANNWATKTSGPVAGGEYSAKYNAQLAATSATNAASSATAASTSATNAASSESAASTSATNAASSASSAATSATTATTQATNASNSASAASTSATNAASSATSASTSATNAAASATTATTQAGIATTQASNAASSASSAATQASNAATSATNAASSATSAASSATAAAASYDSFDDRYLGPKSTAPTLDNDGNALLTGALYFNTSTNTMKVWSGSAWLDAYASLSGALLATNNLSDLNNTATARTNLGVAIGSNVQAWDADLDAIAALAGTSGFLKKTAANTWSLDTSTYLTGNQTVTLSGDITGSGATAITTTLANSGVTAGTYTKVTVDAKGRVTVGAALASGDLPTYTGTITSSQVTTGLGYTPVNIAGDTMTGKLTLPASTTTTAGLNIGNGTAPTTPVAGDLWGTTTGMAYRGSAATYTLAFTNVSQTFSSGQTFNSSITANSTLSLNGASSTNTSLGTSATTGTLTLGGTSQTGTQVVGQSTATHTFNLASGATLSGSTKTLNIGTGGVAGSTTTMTIGSTNGTTIAANGTWTYATAISGSITGNAGTATTLQTARNIALSGDATGTASFNGSADATIATTLATVNANVGTFGSASIVPVVTVNAKGLVTSVSTASISAGITISDDTTTNATRYPVFEDVTSGSSSAAQVSSTKLTFNPSTGTLSATVMTALSDETLKTNWRELPDLIEGMAGVKHGEFDWLDGSGSDVGVSAQSLMNILAQAVKEGDKGQLSVNYGSAALVTCIQLCKRVIELEKKLEGK